MNRPTRRARRKEHAAATPPRQQAVAACAQFTQRRPHFPVVGIGASAGGLKVAGPALRDVPQGIGMAFAMVSRRHLAHISRCLQPVNGGCAS